MTNIAPSDPVRRWDSEAARDGGEVRGAAQERCVRSLGSLREGLPDAGHPHGAQDESREELGQPALQ